MNQEHGAATVLVVDDTPENIDIINGILRSRYRVKAALNGAKALQIAERTPAPDLILLDIMMPEMDGYEVIRRLKSNPRTAGIPVIFVTARSEVADEQLGFELGAVDYITKPVSPPIVEARVRTHLALYDQNRALEQKVLERTEELNRTRLEIIRRLGRAAEYKDNETGRHVIRMSHYSRILAEAVGMPDEWTRRLFEAAPMHDVGKIGIPDRVLLKPGKLDADEWETMKKHVEFGVQIIGDHGSELLKMASVIAQTHHEKWDGSGYPKGLRGEDIPLEGRIVAIADVFDALTTKRPYKDAWPVERAVSLLQEEAGSHFDPGLVPHFVDSLPALLEIRSEFGETE
ncbi:two-component system response regulator [Marinobacterium nitratireducens]|uniref:Two-component system response regulator n=1 Tax=Marinobacterium nitratireducens TaxID=518897 RepID=A0A917ZNQ2_9GAMM|nr:two-component system response regulator [Marinobacterium nitratireducens]GGO87202.1 two-component system response regulator [Marinobacterium nitratireducens]